MKNAIKYTDEPLGDLRVMPDFFPSPYGGPQLVFVGPHSMRAPKTTAVGPEKKDNGGQTV